MIFLVILMDPWKNALAQLDRVAEIVDLEDSVKEALSTPERIEESQVKLEFPEGESFEELKARVSKFLDRLNNHTPEQTVLIVAHGGPLRLLLCYLLELDFWHWRQFQLGVASLSIVDTYPEIAFLSLFNDTSHLI